MLTLVRSNIRKEDTENLENIMKNRFIHRRDLIPCALSPVEAGPLNRIESGNRDRSYSSAVFLELECVQPGLRFHASLAGQVAGTPNRFSWIHIPSLVTTYFKLPCYMSSFNHIYLYH